MNTYPHALLIDSQASAAQLEHAARALQRGEGMVILDGVIALHATATLLRCEVIDHDCLAHRCAEEFKVLIENAQRHLAASTLTPHLPAMPQTWEVVQINGTQRIKLWPDTLI